MRGLPTLEGKLVTLAQFTPDYDQAYLGWMQDEHILRMTGSEKIDSLEGIRDLREYFTESPRIAHFMILDKQGMPIGDTDLRRIQRREMAESTIMIGSVSCRKKGYALEAYCMLLRFGFEMFALDRVYATIVPDNAASAALHRTLGFEVAFKAEDYAVFQRRSQHRRYADMFMQLRFSTQPI